MVTCAIFLFRVVNVRVSPVTIRVSPVTISWADSQFDCKLAYSHAQIGNPVTDRHPRSQVSQPQEQPLQLRSFVTETSIFGLFASYHAPQST